jgi:hypothetical protein
MFRSSKYPLFVAVACVAAVVVAAAGPVSTALATTQNLLWDDFQNGFSVNTTGAKWFYFTDGSYVGDDGVVSTSQQGLRVVASGTNHATGEPAFVRTLAQEDENGGLPGDLDHVKWLAYMNHTASSGYPGFDAIPGSELGCETWIGGQTFGTRAQPFGPAVLDPDDDLRLASVAMNVIDFETYMVFDFWLTNEHIYAYYERLPFGREQLGNYASFSYAIPVARRHAGDMQHLRISYDKAAGQVQWFIDDEEVFHVDRLGYRIGRRDMTIDHGGTETLASPRQLDCGMGMFTLLDGSQPSNLGLVRLSSAAHFYFAPLIGSPVPQAFIDNRSLYSSRLFGQGAEMQIGSYIVRR